MVDDLEVLEQTIPEDIQGLPIRENFKAPSLAKFYGYYNTYELVTFIDNQMAIIMAPDSLKCKLMSLPLEMQP